MKTKKECLHKNTETTEFLVEGCKIPIYTKVNCKDCGITIQKS